MTIGGPRADWLFAQWFEHWADQQPDEMAVRGDDGRCLTYAELDRAGDAVADAIDAVDPDRSFPVVALVLETSVDAVVAIIGGSKAHRPLMGLDPASPPRRLARVLAQLDPAVVVVAGAAKGLLADVPDGRMRSLDLAAVDLEHDAGRRPRPIDLDDLEIIQLTSGSTGVPKAVGRTIRANQAVYSRRQGTPGLGPGERVAVTSGHQWAGGLGRLRDALFTGSSVHVYDTRRRGPAELGPWLAAERITSWSAIPSLATAMLRAMPDVRLPDLRVVTLSGDRVTRTLVEQLRAVLPDDAVINIRYGTTECGVAATYAITASTPLDADLVPVGRPVSGVDVTIDQPDSAGVGEIIVVSGRGSRGYLSGEADGRIQVTVDGRVRYRTGDRGRIRSDGLLEVHGRGDHVVKLRGHRVDLAEVELALVSLPQVEQAAAGLRTVDDQARLTAWVVATEGGDVSVPALRRELRRRLPGYLIPVTFVPVPALPQLLGGKLDRDRLPEPPAGRPDLGQPYEPTPPGVEQTVAAAFERVLGVVPVGRHDAFFDLGGDSLQAAEVMLLVAAELGRDVPLSVFLDAETPAALARALQGSGADTSRLVTMQAEGDGPTMYCVHGAGGQVLSFAALADALGQEQPFVGIQMRQGDSARSLLSVRRLAERYATEILARSGTSACQVMGHSYGAVVAQELARVLRKEQVDVRRCILLDCAVPAWRLVLGLQPGQERLVGNPGDLSRRKELAYLAHAVTGRPPKAHRVTTERMHAATWGMILHRTRPVDVPLLAIEATEGAPGRDLREWGRFTTAGCTVVAARGDHHSILTPPHVQGLADALVAHAAS